MKIGIKVAKIMDNNKNQFTFKLYPPLRIATKASSSQRVGMF
jgi:hypothetical protein